MKTGLDGAPCCLFSSGDDGAILEVNDMLCRELGYSREELVGAKVDILFTLATRIFYQTHFFPLLKMQGHAAEIFISLQAKDKEHIPMLINAERREEPAGAVITFAGITVHNRKKFEDELVAARKAAEAALSENTDLLTAKSALQQQMEQLDRQMQLTQKQHEELKQFNRVVTHDLQEPLRKMSVFSHMLLDGTYEKFAAEPQPIIEKLLRVTGTMRAVISGLQQYIWLTEDHGHLTGLHLPDLLPEVEQNLEKEFPEAELALTVEPVPSFPADRDQMSLLLYQLLSNAIRFRKENAPANVRISGTVIEQNVFRNIAGKYRYQRFLKLVVADEGVGFNPEYSLHVFDLFRRLHDTSGRGVGLSLCKKIVENHSGTITADSRAGGGTTITILLPMERPDSGTEPASA